MFAFFPLFQEVTTTSSGYLRSPPREFCAPDFEILHESMLEMALRVAPSSRIGTWTTFLCLRNSSSRWDQSDYLNKGKNPLVPILSSSESTQRPWGGMDLFMMHKGFTESHRITDWSGLEGTSVGHPAQPPA